MKKVIFSMSGVGGRGKTTLSKAISEEAVKHNQSLLVVECDEPNPNVFRYFKVSNESEYCENKINIMFKKLMKDITKLIQVIDNADEEIIIFNFPAGTNTVFAENAFVLNDGLSSLEAEIKVYWLAGNDDSSISLFKDAFKNMPYGEFTIIKNRVFGDDDDEGYFEWNENEDVKKILSENSIKEVDLPKLHSQVSYIARQNKVKVSDLLKVKDLDDRWAMSLTAQWEMKCEKMIEELEILK